MSEIDDDDEVMILGVAIYNGFTDLVVKGEDGSEKSFVYLRSTKLKKIMKQYCFEKSLYLKSVTFLFNGRVLRGLETLEELGMDRRGEIHAIVDKALEKELLMEKFLLVKKGKVGNGVFKKFERMVLD